MAADKINTDVALDKIELKDQERGKKRWDENGFEEQGGYMAAKKAKLEHQFNESITANTGVGIFDGISIHINGYVSPAEPLLREQFILHGGTYHPYRTVDTTFVIASNLSTSSKNLYGPKAIKADWITDSITEGRKLDHRKYRLYDYNKEQNQYTLSQMISRPQANGSEKALNGHITLTNGGGIPHLESEPNGINHTLKKDASENNNKETVVDANRIANQTQTFSNANVEMLPKLDSSVSNDKVSFATDVNGDSSTIVNTDLKGDGPSEKINNIRKMKFITEDGYIEDFFGNSRLHLLSSHKKAMQLLIYNLRKNSSTHKFPNLEIFKSERRMHTQQSWLNANNNPVVLMHIDLDCFFVSVGLLSRPHLINKPLAVSHSKGTTNNSKSDIACASYEARKFGVSNGMWVSQAKQLCPSLEIIPYDFEEYKRVSTLFFETVATVTLNIEPKSIDEMVIDVTAILNQVPDSTPEELAVFFRKIIFNATKCPASVGIGTNKLRAKLATKKAKPDGVYFLKDNEVCEFIGNLPIRELPGIGYSNHAKLKESFSVETCKDLLSVPILELKAQLGDRAAEHVKCLCLGIYTCQLDYDTARPKNISVDINYGVRLTHDKEVFDFLDPLSKEVARRLENAQATTLHLQLKLLVRRKGAGDPIKFGGHGLVDSLTRSGSLLQSSRKWSDIYRLLSNLLRRASVPANDIRGIGVTCSNLHFDFDRKGPKTKQVTLVSMSRGKEMIQKAQEQVLKKNQHCVSTSTSDSNNDATDISSNSIALGDLNGIEDNAEHKTPTTSPTVDEDPISSTTGLPISSCIQTDQGSQYNVLDSQIPSSSVIQNQPQTAAPKAIAAVPALPSNEWLNPQDPSTVDINVLKELPKYLALEVAREYGIQLDESQLEPDSDIVNGIPPQEDEEHVDYSRIEDPEADVNVDNQGNNFYPQVNAEMNPYQNIESLDPSFLSALPANVRNEVVIQFQQAKGLKGQYPSHSIDDPQPCSSRQAIERDMQLRNGNMGPLGVCESVYNVPTSTTSETSSSNSSSTMPSSKIMKPHSNMIRRVQEEEKALAVNETRMPSPTKQRPVSSAAKNPIDWNNFWNSSYPCKPLCSAKPATLPSLCGETDVEEIRKKIRQGLQETDEPTDEDVRNLTLYFDALLNEGWVSQAQVLIRMIHRELESSERQKWDNVLRDLILHVQRVCKKKYGGYLRFE